MGRIQWKIFAVLMAGIFTTLPFAIAFVPRHPWLLFLPFGFMAVLMAYLFATLLIQPLRAMRLKRTGVPVVGRVMHARASGTVNWITNWELEVQLPNGSTTRLMVVRNRPFSPGEPIDLRIDPRTDRAVAAPGPSADF